MNFQGHTPPNANTVSSSLVPNSPTHGGCGPLVPQLCARWYPRFPTLSKPWASFLPAVPKKSPLKIQVHPVLEKVSKVRTVFSALPTPLGFCFHLDVDI